MVTENIDNKALWKNTEADAEAADKALFLLANNLPYIHPMDCDENGNRKIDANTVEARLAAERVAIYRLRLELGRIQYRIENILLDRKEN